MAFWLFFVTKTSIFSSDIKTSTFDEYNLNKQLNEIDNANPNNNNSETDDDLLTEISSQYDRLSQMTTVPPSVTQTEKIKQRSHADKKIDTKITDLNQLETVVNKLIDMRLSKNINNKSPATVE